MSTEPLDAYPVFDRKRRGYDREAVDAHLDRMAERYNEVRLEREDLARRVTELNRELEGYRGLEQKVGNALLLAEGAAANARDKAAAESEQIIEQARLRADEIVGESQKEYERLLAEVERLLALRAEIASGYRAFLLSALELVEEHPGHALGEKQQEEEEDQPEEDQSEKNEESAATTVRRRRRVARS